MKTHEHHLKYIAALRSKYIFPDYAELVGPPQDNHYDEKGHLTAQRKATLLLIGVFDWRGIKIAKHQAVFGFYARRGAWTWDEEPAYLPYQKGWYVPIKKNRPGSDKLIVDDFFRPLRNYRCQRLEEFLTPHEKYTKVRLIDGDYYNCHPDNIEVVKARGREMTCWFCGLDVTAKASKRFKWDRGTVRACFDCLMYDNVPLAWHKPVL